MTSQDQWSEYLVRTSPWGDSEIEPIKPPWRRQKRVASRFDGALITAVTPLSDLQLIWLARCMSPDEKRRFDRIYESEVLEPLKPAVAALDAMDAEWKKLPNSVGRHSGITGKTKLEILLARVLIHRIHELALQALAAQELHRKKRSSTTQIPDFILSGLCKPVEGTSGGLKGRIISPVVVLVRQIFEGLTPGERDAFVAEPAAHVQRMFREVVMNTLFKDIRKRHSKAFWITFDLWSSIGEPITERSMRRILKSSIGLRVTSDLIPD